MNNFRQRPAPSVGGSAQAVPKVRKGYVSFAGHFGVMVALMYAGMLVLDPVYETVAGIVGVDDPWGRLPVLSNIVMAFNMTVPMVLYMRRRRHTWRAVVDMSAAMLLPAALTTVPYLLGVMRAGTMMSFSHATMILLMAVAMVLRFREYAGHKKEYGLAATAQESGM
ncbi:MAG: hypothetical protein ABI563_06960 [Specibacter sp.]